MGAVEGTSDGAVDGAAEAEGSVLGASDGVASFVVSVVSSVAGVVRPEPEDEYTTPPLSPLLPPPPPPPFKGVALALLGTAPDVPVEGATLPVVGAAFAVEGAAMPVGGIAAAAGLVAAEGVVRFNGAGQPLNSDTPSVKTIALCICQTVLSATEMPASPSKIIDMTQQHNVGRSA